MSLILNYRHPERRPGMSTKILPVINEDGNAIRSEAGEVIYQVIQGPHKKLRGSIAELTEQIGPVHWEEDAFVLDEQGWIVEPGVAASFNPVEALGLFHQKAQREADTGFIAYLSEADTLEDLLGPGEEL
jgi:hypothetical protein